MTLTELGHGVQPFGSFMRRMNSACSLVTVMVGGSWAEVSGWVSPVGAGPDWSAESGGLGMVGVAAVVEGSLEVLSSPSALSLSASVSSAGRGSRWEGGTVWLAILRAKDRSSFRGTARASVGGVVVGVSRISWRRVASVVMEVLS